MQALKTIDAARTMMARVPLPRGSAAIPSSVDVFTRQFGVNPAVLANRIRELHTGRSERAYTIANVLTNIFNRKAGQNLDDAFRVVLYDPQAADAMVKSIMAGKDGPHAKELLARFFAVGITPFREDDRQSPSLWPGEMETVARLLRERSPAQEQRNSAMQLAKALEQHQPTREMRQ
jgi:hypothetical protein